MSLAGIQERRFWRFWSWASIGKLFFTLILIGVVGIGGAQGLVVRDSWFIGLA